MTLCIQKLVEENTLERLTQIATDCGISGTGRKLEIAERLESHFKSFSEVPESIISLDLGYKNLAFCHVDKNRRILFWERIDLDLPEFHPSVSAPYVRYFVKKRLEPLMKYPVGAVVVEKQRHRSGGRSNVFETTVRVNTVEAMLWSELYALKQKFKRLNLAAMNRITVDNRWREEMEYPQSSYAKKRASAVMVWNWLVEDKVVQCSDEIKDIFFEDSKKDDMADSLTQALTWYECIERTLQYKKQYK
ncbi:hypothetical protein DFQ28_011667 [Apophysomyces sp. BC1034]|nr:hypothetical protein DFQ28_011667 [Apophysomyces sp. BC1034]